MLLEDKKYILYSPVKELYFHSLVEGVLTTAHDKDHAEIFHGASAADAVLSSLNIIVDPKSKWEKVEIPH